MLIVFGLSQAIGTVLLFISSLFLNVSWVFTTGCARQGCDPGNAEVSSRIYSVTEPQEYVWSEGHSHVTLLATLCIHFILTQGTRMNVASLTLRVSL